VCNAQNFFVQFHGYDAVKETVSTNTSIHNDHKQFTGANVPTCWDLSERTCFFFHGLQCQVPEIVTISKYSSNKQQGKASSK
jgi:hypothetical protein